MKTEKYCNISLLGKAYKRNLICYLSHTYYYVFITDATSGLKMNERHEKEQ
jgi:hypothetical protein